MGKIPEQLRQIIAANIRACRMKKFPESGGGKKCAEAFGVSPQQWSPWERGMRTPDELRLSQIASFFGVTVEHMRRDNSAPDMSSKNNPHNAEAGVSPNGETPNDRENRQTDCEPKPQDLFFPHCPLRFLVQTMRAALFSHSRSRRKLVAWIRRRISRLSHRYKDCIHPFLRSCRAHTRKPADFEPESLSNCPAVP